MPILKVSFEVDMREEAADIEEHIHEIKQILLTEFSNYDCDVTNILVEEKL